MKNQKAPRIELPLPSVGGKHRDLYDILIGKRSSKDFHNAAGLLLGSNALLTINDDRVFVVAMAVGSSLYRVGEIHKSNPAMLAIRDELTTFGPTPAEIERERKRREYEQMSADEHTEAVVETMRKQGLDARVVKPGQWFGPLFKRRDKRNAPDLPIV